LLKDPVRGNDLLVKHLTERITYNGITWYLCLWCCQYHRAIDVTRKCFNLGHVFKRDRHTKEMMSMKKPESVATQKGQFLARDEKFPKKMPCLWEYLSTTTWEDGGDRQTSTVTVFVEEGAFKAALNDRDQQRSLYATAETLEGAFLALEKALSGGTADWRAWHVRGKKK